MVFPLCHWDGYTCSGDLCYVRRFLHSDGVIYTKWGCLQTAIHHVNLICEQGAFNSDTEHYTCCSDEDNCNENMRIVLPIEHSTEAATPTTVSTLAMPTTTEEPAQPTTTEYPDPCLPEESDSSPLPDGGLV